MSSAFKLLLTCTMCSALCAADLRVCSDPNNLPFSNSRREGFENKIAELLAHDLGRHLRYSWIPQREAFFRRVRTGACDIAIGVPASFRLVRTTRPYYRSSYVFVSRHDRHFGVHSFDDPMLKRLRIGVQFIGAEDASIPPVQAMMNRGLMSNIVWYRPYENYGRTALIDAVAHGDLDMAVSWGPLAGYFAKREPARLNVVPVSPRFEGSVPFVFEISMGVWPGDDQLLVESNAFLEQRRTEIRRLLKSYGVPLVERAVLQHRTRR